MHYYLYEIKNLVNGKIYVGVHKTTDMNDGYMGSGKIIKSAIAKYGLENFTKTILEEFEDVKQMFARESEIVSEQFLTRDDVYNLRRGGTGGFDYINATIDFTARNRTVANARDYSAPDYRAINIHNLTKARVIANEAYQKLLTDNGGGWWEPSYGFAGKSHSAETKLKISVKAKAIPKEKRSQFGTMWITDGYSNSKIMKNSAIPEGWRAGRVL